MGVLKAAFLFLRALVIPKFVLAMENLALRQQVAVFKQSVKRPKLRSRERPHCSRKPFRVVTWGLATVSNDVTVVA